MIQPEKYQELGRQSSRRLSRFPADLGSATQVLEITTTPKLHIRQAVPGL